MKRKNWFGSVFVSLFLLLFLAIGNITFCTADEQFFENMDQIFKIKDLKTFSIIDGLIYASSDGSLNVFDAKTGNKIWSYDTAGFVCFPPCVDKDTVLIGSYVPPLTLGGVFYAIDRNTHELKWKKTLQEKSFSCIVSNGVVVFTTLTDVKAFDVTTGNELWFKILSLTSKFICQVPIISENIVYIGLQKAKLSLTFNPVASPDYIFAYDLYSGQLLWEKKTPNTLSLFSMDEDKLYFIDEKSGLTFLDKKTGEVVSNDPTLNDGNWLIKLNNHMIVGQKKRIYLFNILSSDKKWEISFDSPIISICTDNNNIYLLIEDSYVHVIDLESGKEKTKFKTPYSPPAIPMGLMGNIFLIDDIFYIYTGNGFGGDLYALRQKLEMKKDEDIKKLLMNGIVEEKTNENSPSIVETQPTITITDNVLPDSTTQYLEGRILYQTGFESGSAIGWKLDGMKVEKEENDYVLSDANSSNAAAYMVDNIPWRDYSLSFQVKRMPLSDGGFQICVRHNGGSPSSRYQVHFEEYEIKLAKDHRNTYDILTRANCIFDEQLKWYTVTIIVLSNHIQVMLDNQRLIDYTDNEKPILYIGGIKIFIETLAHFHFDNVKVTALKTNLPK